jgi:hypothetical protein
MKETTKIIIAFILGILVSGVVAYATSVLSSDKVSYDKTTVKDSLDNLFNDSLTGKNNIISALSNKGFSVTNNSTYNEIVNSINELPITLAKDEDGNYGYILEGSDTVNSFSNGVTLKSTSVSVDTSNQYYIKISGFNPDSYYILFVFFVTFEPKISGCTVLDTYRYDKFTISSEAGLTLQYTYGYSKAYLIKTTSNTVLFTGLSVGTTANATFSKIIYPIELIGYEP